MKFKFQITFMLFFVVISTSVGQSMSTIQFQIFSTRSIISGEAYDAGDYSNPSGFGFDFIIGSQFAGLIGMKFSVFESENSFEDDGYLWHIPIGIQYKANKWKYNPYIKASYSIISGYNSEYSEITDSWGWGSNSIGGDFVGNSI